MASPVRVVIVTSDGYEAWGRAADPVGAATDYMLVDAFTRFLEKRVVTQNMALLRRMMAEYFCHCETTVRQFIAQCSTQISIGPLDAEDPNNVAEAARVLHQPRSFVRSGLSASVFTFLVTKLRTARASLLMQFFVDFCQGKDTALREFIEKREGFVSILPLAAPQLEHSPFALSDSIPFESVDPLPMPPPTTTTMNATTPKNTVSTKATKPVIQPAGKKRKAITREQYDHRSLGEDEQDGGKQSSVSAVVAESHMDDPASDEDQPDPTAFNTSFNHPDEAMNKVKAKLVADMVNIEADEPWAKVFSSELSLPFDEATHPDLARMLREFWRRYARTAWERNFWAPLRPETNPTEINLRRSRQRNAVIVFERILTACFKRFGPKFFYKLDRKHHPGWWYRSTCVDLLGLSSIVGYDKCLEYVKAQQYARFPDCGHPLPLRSANMGVVQRQKAAQVSQSLWLITSKPDIQAIKSKFVAYVAKKDKKKRLKKAAKLSDKQAATVRKAKARASSVPVTLTPGTVRTRTAVKASNNHEQEQKAESAEAPAPETNSMTLGGGKEARDA